MNQDSTTPPAVPAVGAQVERGVRPQRLWIVRVVHEVYVLAEDEEKAKQARREIERWEDFPTMTAEPWAGRHLAGWNDDCVVYGAENLSLGTAKWADFAV